MSESLPKTGMMSPKDGIPASCPCCSFLSGDDLFPSLDIIDGSIDRAQPQVTMASSGDRSCGGKGTTTSSLEAPGRTRDAAAAICSNDGASEGRRRGIMLVDTHSFPRANYKDGVSGDDNDSACMVSLTCTVSESDWTDALAPSSRSDQTLPSLGVHPGYLSNLSDTYLSGLEDLLCHHPNAIKREIGLCRVAKFVRDYPAGKAAAMEFQRRVFREQFDLAVELGRPVTVHCVGQHDVFMAVLKEIREERRGSMAAERKRREMRKARSEEDTEDLGADAEGMRLDNAAGSLADAFPPAVEMHSFTGTAHHVEEILKFEESLFLDNTWGDFSVDGEEESGKAKKRPPIFYFDFSHSAKVLMCSSYKSRWQSVEVVRAVPQERLIAKSDVLSFGMSPFCVLPWPESSSSSKYM